ncbi:molybdopterin molybdotransferase MoeA [Alteromonas halophila]|uniref:Molybdopterin molybdenumtransferase n=1 Tax=Alteromonas halophila TaxID=516698 RepID=A0A918JPS7_9ALTE|nr:gephyrin-like molybdotransferase Glp [Alteromonas halophila]GGW95758.1 molybdopterin biosynthesis protein MoeA [Alteromonas halophila]
MATSANWLSLSQASAKIAQAATTVTDTETVALSDALGRVLAADLNATQDVPPWDNAGMDGYAVACDDTDADLLPVQGVITAGQSDIPALNRGACLRIMTGAPLPAGADAVVMQENTSRHNDAIRCHVPPSPGDNIRRRGCDISRHEVLLNQGTLLGPAHLMVIAAQGRNDVTVTRKLKVGVLTTGDELIEPGGTLHGGQIFDANRTGISALLHSLPVTVTDYGIVKDEPAQLRDVFERATNSQDVLISSGGVSVGDADFVKSVVAQAGSIDFWKVAIKPGKPFAFGKLGHTLFCGVPGNPVSAYVTTQMLVLPLLASLCGMPGHEPPLSRATLTATINRRPERQEFMRARYENNAETGLRVTPLPRQSSAVMTSVTQANCYLLIEADCDGIEQGEQVSILAFNPMGSV